MGTATATIPFSMSKYGHYVSTDTEGQPQTLAFSGFGSGVSEYLQEGEWKTGTITFREDTEHGPSFILPYEAVVKKISVMMTTTSILEFEEGVVIIPFVCLAISNSDSLVFTVLQETMTYLERYEGGVEYPPLIARRASSENLDVLIPQNSVVAIVSGIIGENVTEEQYAEFLTSGGVFLEYTGIV